MNTENNLSTIYTVASESHKVFLPWFNTIKNVYPNIKTEIKYINQVCETGKFGDPGWSGAVFLKLSMLNNLLNAHPDNSIFVYSDVDVQFFKPFHSILNKLLENYDIVFQSDRFAQCSGFFACKKTKITKFLFTVALNLMKSGKAGRDQVAINLALEKVPIKYISLPMQFFNYTFSPSFELYKKNWEPEFGKLNIPKSAFMHHANWTLGIENKLKMLQCVKDEYEEIIKIY